MNGGRGRYALLALLVFLTEVAIALFVRDRLIRPLVGDGLAVILLYLVIRAATRLRLAAAVCVSLAAALAVELGQLLDVIDLIGLRENRVARVVLGASFDPLDLLAYLAGAIGIVAGEALVRRRKRVATADASTGTG